MHHIHPLTSTPLSTIVAALNKAFDGYLVQLPTDLEYWQDRYRAARLDQSLSFGWWEDGELVGFILHGVDDFQGCKTAFDIGTGVVEAYRGRGMVDALYAHALPILRSHGVKQCALEVIQTNARAIKVYERIGFTKQRNLRCFKGTVVAGVDGVTIEPAEFPELTGLPGREWDSWDNTDGAIAAGSAVFQCRRVLLHGQTIGHFVINPKTGHLPRLEATEPDSLDAWRWLLQGAALISPLLRVNNVDDRRQNVVQGLLAAGLENPVDQWEMAMRIGN